MPSRADGTGIGGPDCNSAGPGCGYAVAMALLFSTLPGARDRSLVNTVPGLKTTGSRGIRGPETGAALKLTQRRQKWGQILGWVCLGLSITFFGSVLVRLVCQAWWTELDAMIFGLIWGITAMVVHVGVFVAEGLRGRDAPRAVMGVVVFWAGMLVMWLV